MLLSVGSRDGPGQAVILQPGHPVWAPHDLSPVSGTGAPVCVHGRHHPCHPQNGGRHVSHTDIDYIVGPGIDSSCMVNVSILENTIQLISGIWANFVNRNRYGSTFILCNHNYIQF